MTILIVAIGFSALRANADEPFAKVTVGGRVGYIVPKEYAERPDSHLGGDATQQQHDHLTFWTPSAEQAKEAEMAVKRFISAGATNVKLAFPDVAARPEKFAPHALHDAADEIKLVDKDYEKYVRQFVGICFGEDNLIYCSYVLPESLQVFHLDASSSFILISDGGHAIWQIKYDIRTKHCLNLQINGPWVDEE